MSRVRIPPPAWKSAFSGAAVFAVVAAVVASVIVVGEVAADEEIIESKEEEMLALLTAIDARLARLEGTRRPVE